ncbi:hypothetical protein CSA56_10750 [candidate division KSB3 bacterium]|uniref:Uncharacterized protein n=1 Tax=candidate division KSB3 bacterium TaxID=2044937 RepID=A0A2G6KFK5_9BACT|nr:MAG: hypothetical protein CSA56_10750 [candidate division KSB3 bacterium]
MKKQDSRGSFLVYLAGLLVLAGLVGGTMFYVNWAKTKQANSQQTAVEQVQHEAENRLTKVKVVDIMPIPFIDTLVLPGTVRPFQDIDLASKLSGVIEWIGPKEGEWIKKGQKLLQVSVESVKTRVTEAHVRYKQAQKDYERAKKLHSENIISRNQLDTAKTQLDTLKASLDSASVDLGDGTIYSPIDGILDRRDVDRGEYINPGQAVMRIVNIGQIYVELSVPEKDILYFEKGQTVDLEMSIPRTGTCENPKEVEGEQQCWFTGTIDFISVTADPSTRTYLVKVLVDNADSLLRPGMIVRAHLTRRELDDAIAVPFFTIIDREDGKAVFVVEEGIARVRSIRYGTFEKGLVEVRSGLDPGDRLIIVGQRGLVDGQRVEIAQDLTPLAKQWIAQGKDLSEVPIDILK